MHDCLGGAFYDFGLLCFLNDPACCRIVTVGDTNLGNFSHAVGGFTSKSWQPGRRCLAVSLCAGGGGGGGVVPGWTDSLAARPIDERREDASPVRRGPALPAAGVTYIRVSD